MRRRDFLVGAGGAFAAMLRGPTLGAIPKIRNGNLSWSLNTLCGINMGYDSFWGRKVVHGQYEAFARYGCTFVRGMFFSYVLGAYKPGQLDPAVHQVTKVRPYESDHSQLVLVCDSLTYSPSVGDKIVLSRPITYSGSNGAEVTLPAKIALSITGAAIGSLHDAQGFVFGGEVRVRPGTKDDAIAGNNEQLVSSTDLLHLNFYKAAGVLRNPIARYVDQAHEWMAQGFGFDHGGWHDNWYDLLVKFGEDNVQQLREQEWTYFANLGWSPKQALICDENEPVWPGADASAKWNLYKPYFRDIVYPRMRFYFPQHTLGFGCPDWCSINQALSIDWWPSDPNTLLRVHYYPGKGGKGVDTIDPETRAPLDDEFLQLASLQRRMKIPLIYIQEYGVPFEYPNRSVVLRNIRQSAQARGWPCAVWVAYGQPKKGSFQTAELDGSGLWQPVETASGAFGED